jgi:CTP-dependent riboflavin kinase
MKSLIKKLLREGLLSEITEEAYELLKTKYKDSRVIMSKVEEIK